VKCIDHGAGERKEKDMQKYKIKRKQIEKGILATR